MTDYLNLFAMANNLTLYRGRYYGTYNDYNLCMRMDGSDLLCFFTTRISETTSFFQIMDSNGKEHFIEHYSITAPILSVVVASANEIKDSLDFVTEALHMCHATTSDVCAFCSEKIDNPVYFLVDEVVCCGHEKCFHHFEYTVNKKYIDRRNKEVSPIKAIWLPIVYCLISSLAVMAVYILTKQTTLFYFMIGCFAMGFLAETGYVQHRGRSGLHGYLVPMAVCFVFVLATQACTQAYFITADYSFAVGIKVFFTSWLNPQALSELLLPQLVGGLFFALIGVFLVDTNRLAFIRRNTVDIRRL